jgi:competence ComEA-like helix-hairpin-helix protein
MTVDKEQIINVNTASIDELTSLSGIGKKLAQEIIARRPFSKVNDLVNVPGISERKFETLLPYVTTRTKQTRTPSPQKAVPQTKTPKKQPENKFGQTETFVFLEDQNERKDALMIIFAGFILGLIILSLRRNTR